MLFEAGSYGVEVIEKNKIYLTKYIEYIEAETREKWRKVAYEVKTIDNGESFVCEYGQFGLSMAILLIGTGTRGYRTRMGRVWANFFTHR